ncbi:potassium-transporting ATPase subunit KdpB [Roseomonas sp. NAR14]|uniref:Potassium-transporting ATPase ATP-binding subunit n=1 Tax=Roseomonas acroporae TaxID=2937791 RepID=A0A9X1YC58_9PROT|nr:potassium-transporting ATPase subunit KdpB [Roseomonas acroporae]MCK8786290.1 potassium-transporting ATPase subunit KdpB [Roseomonas acroporae]
MLDTTTGTPALAGQAGGGAGAAAPSLLDGAILRRATAEAFRKLDPRTLLRNPVIFVTEVVAALVTVLALRDAAIGHAVAFQAGIAAWLWLTVLFATFAEAVAEGRGKARAESLRRARGETMARWVPNPADPAITAPRAAAALGRGDHVLVEAGELIPSDGEVVQGIASVNEAAITGESAPVIREAGGDRSAVTGGTLVVSDRILVRITAEPGATFLDRMIAMVEGAARQKTPNEIALDILLAGMTIVFLIAVATLVGFASWNGAPPSVTVLAALLVTLIPTTIGGLLSAIGIAGMDRLVRFNVLATSGRAVEAAGDVDVLLLDKTGTITLGNRQAAAFVPAAGVPEGELAEAAVLASLADETPEGRSILAFARDRHGLAAPAMLPAGAVAVPFTAQTRISGMDLPGRGAYRKGAVDALAAALGQAVPADLAAAVERIARAGGTPLAVARDGRLLGAIELKDIVKPGMRERFAALRRMGIRTVMVTGDNRLTAAAIAAEAGVDDFLAEAKPQDKLDYIRRAQADGRLVAMAGDGTNDAPALAQADVGLAMQTGTQAAREAGNMVDLDSDPTKLIEVVGIGKGLLITRGALTTFSIANDVAKYFAILPAIFVAQYPGLAALNVMRLTSPESAILSAVIFNALIIVALVPLALRGVGYAPVGAAALLRRNLLVYGLGGIAAPFLGIKLIDLLLTLSGIA